MDSILSHNGSPEGEYWEGSDNGGQRAALPQGSTQSEVLPVRRFLGVEVSADEYNEICRNLGVLFDLLKKWQCEEVQVEKTDPPA